MARKSPRWYGLSCVRKEASTQQIMETCQMNARTNLKGASIGQIWDN